MYHLGETMHPGVSASRAVHPEREVRICHLGQGEFECGLYRFDVEVGLGLPATIGAPVIFNTAGYSATRRQRVSRKRDGVNQYGLAAHRPRL